jgi:hypothetical protein
MLQNLPSNPTQQLLTTYPAGSEQLQHYETLRTLADIGATLTQTYGEKLNALIGADGTEAKIQRSMLLSDIASINANAERTRLGLLNLAMNTDPTSAWSRDLIVAVTVVGDIAEKTDYLISAHAWLSLASSTSAIATPTMGALLQVYPLQVSPTPAVTMRRPVALEGGELLDLISQALKAGRISRQEMYGLLMPAERGQKAAPLEVQIRLNDRYEELKRRRGSDFSQAAFMAHEGRKIWPCSVKTFERYRKNVKRLRALGLI